MFFQSIVERSPDGRYVMYNEILGRGAFKDVYKGFDEVEGIEIAWNKICMDETTWENRDNFCFEAVLLKSLENEGIIRCYSYWLDDKTKTFNMITELFCSGSLRYYRKIHKSIDLKAIKNWARQILLGLNYLHTRNPVIIHRDIKCDNVLVNGYLGEVKIGDLGLATVLPEGCTARSIAGTPQFMAPEFYDDEGYNELVDIYAFGMCILELVTGELPYSECENSGQIFKKVISGVRPAALGRVNDAQVKEFIEKCLVESSRRLSASELLKDPFLSSQCPKDCHILMDIGQRVGKLAIATSSKLVKSLSSNDTWIDITINSSPSFSSASMVSKDDGDNDDDEDEWFLPSEFAASSMILVPCK